MRRATGMRMVALATKMNTSQRRMHMPRSIARSMAWFLRHLTSSCWEFQGHSRVASTPRVAAESSQLFHNHRTNSDQQMPQAENQWIGSLLDKEVRLDCKHAGRSQGRMTCGSKCGSSAQPPGCCAAVNISSHRHSESGISETLQTPTHGSEICCRMRQSMRTSANNRRSRRDTYHCELRGIHTFTTAMHETRRLDESLMILTIELSDAHSNKTPGRLPAFSISSRCSQPLNVHITGVSDIL
jgi:hypothetical protein